MATQLLSYASGEASSSDITVVDGSTATVFLKANGAPYAAYDAQVYIELKDSDGNYIVLGVLTPQQPAYVISGKGTYRLRRRGNGVSVGAGQG